MGKKKKKRNLQNLGESKPKIIVLNQNIRLKEGFSDAEKETAKTSYKLCSIWLPSKREENTCKTV